jgi:pimeloyl-ACP methyl ester carboxylesterase
MKCQLENVTIHYEAFGEGRPLVALHGWPLDRRSMVSDLEPLFARREGWRRIYPDLPGMGETPSAGWITNQDQVLDVVLGFIDHVIPDQRFVLAGYSVGGYVARGVVYRRAASMDGLLLMAPAMMDDDLPERVVLVEDPVLIAELEPDEAQSFQDGAVVQSQACFEAARATLFPAFEVADHAFLSRLHESRFSFDVDALPEPFAGSALIVTGRQDFVRGYRGAWGILEDLTRGTFAVLDRAGHRLTIEQRGLFDALANEWLDRVEEYAKGGE